jgi:acetolactate synthase-1/2/3 large subunit
LKPEFPAKVAYAVARTLAKFGVRFAFGIPGNDVLETVRACEEHGIDFVLGKSEPSCAFMADAVYQLTGAPAVLIAALGPGISNAMSGIAGAMQERSALLVLSGEMATANMGIYNHQVFDHVALARPVTKYAEQLNPKRAAQQVAKALDIALAYPAGPVLLNVPADHNRAEAAGADDYRPARIAATALDPGEAARLAKLLSAANRPLLLAGRGALLGQAPQALAAFVEAWRLPFLCSYKAKGVIAEQHPLCLGSVGLSPVVDAENMKLVREADLILMVGFDPIELRDAWLDAWPESQAAVSLDWGPLNHRVFPEGERAYGHLPRMLAQLMPDSATDKSASWGKPRLQQLKNAVAHIVRPRTPAKGISPAALFAAVSEQVTEDWIMTVDVGAHRILANHVIRCRAPGQMLQSNGLGCMGYAVPAAIGAQLVHPDKTVVAMLGDGCMLMTQGELAVAAERNLPLVVVVLNDASLSLIKLKQSKMNLAPQAASGVRAGTASGVRVGTASGDRVGTAGRVPYSSTDFVSPRFDIIAQGFGAKGVRVNGIAAFDQALREAVASRRFTVIDAEVDPSEYWEQM